MKNKTLLLILIIVISLFISFYFWKLNLLNELIYIFLLSALYKKLKNKKNSNINKGAKT